MADSERLRVPGPRDVRATLDVPEESDRERVETVVVACPPHPQMGGDRRDGRLRAVSDALTERGCACLRIDYGPWDEGQGERRDVRAALEWGRNGYERVCLFGYSFGAGVSLVAASEECAEGTCPAAVSVLAPPASSGGESTVEALDDIDVPLQVIYGENDETVDWEPVVERARERGASVEGVPGNHFFAGQQDGVAGLVGEFLAEGQE